MIWEKSDMVDFIIYSFYNYFIKRVQRGTWTGMSVCFFYFILGLWRENMAAFERICSGIPDMDQALDNIRLGDNVVWRVSNLQEFRYFCEPYIE